MKVDLKLIGYITTFENFTKSDVKDCFFRDKELVFIVKEGQLGKAVGKNGINAKKLSDKLKWRIKIIGFDADPVKFLKNLLYPQDGYEIETVEKKIIIKPKDNKIKGRIFGRDKSNFNWVKEVFSRYFKELEIKME